MGREIPYLLPPRVRPLLFLPSCGPLRRSLCAPSQGQSFLLRPGFHRAPARGRSNASLSLPHPQGSRLWGLPHSMQKFSPALIPSPYPPDLSAASDTGAPTPIPRNTAFLQHQEPPTSGVIPPHLFVALSHSSAFSALDPLPFSIDAHPRRLYLQDRSGDPPSPPTWVPS